MTEILTKSRAGLSTRTRIIFKVYGRVMVRVNELLGQKNNFQGFQYHKNGL